ncbi:MAG: hypothetical protein LBP67_09915, partial [Bacteroidales bacterium]|nr:hypothetical protein [Bacteroidales bacterium]
MAFAILFNIVSVFSQGGITGPLNWKIENDTLIISGEGAMLNYPPPMPGSWPSPWHDYEFSAV